MQTHAEFRSVLFPLVARENEQVNPGRHGKLLAQFIHDGLTERGFSVDRPVAEDWGWCISIRNDRFRLWIGCGNCAPHTDRFVCFIEPQVPVIKKRLRRIDTTARVYTIYAALDDMLNVEGITEKKWSADRASTP